ncbi:MAG: hypothetical protein AAF460_11265 [Pseudomonadota bacterium]
MLRLIAGPVGLVLCGVIVALVVAYLCNARGRWLAAIALVAVPTTFVGILIHDLLDLDVGLSPLTSTLVVVSTTTGVVAGLIATLFATRAT